jgi:hypothetical protein
MCERRLKIGDGNMNTSPPVPSFAYHAHCGFSVYDPKTQPDRATNKQRIGSVSPLLQPRLHFGSANPDWVVSDNLQGRRRKP